MYCKSGRHRSVALATGLHRVFALRGYRVRVVHTESTSGWKFRCGYLHARCQDCSLERRLDPLHAFVQEWYKAEAKVGSAT